jgi:hypothetical protein
VFVSSLLHGENLVRSMLTGYKFAKPGEGIRYRHRLIGAALVAAVVAFWIAGPDSLSPTWDPSKHAAAADARPRR